jgi:hypothetical protein
MLLSIFLLLHSEEGMKYVLFGNKEELEVSRFKYYLMWLVYVL